MYYNRKLLLIFFTLIMMKLHCMDENQKIITQYQTDIKQKETEIESYQKCIDSISDEYCSEYLENLNKIRDNFQAIGTIYQRLAELEDDKIKHVDLLLEAKKNLEKALEFNRKAKTIFLKKVQLLKAQLDIPCNVSK